MLRAEDYPATFAAADAAGARAQKTHFTLFLANAGAAFLAALFTTLSGVTPPAWRDGFSYGAAVLLAVAVIVLWLSRARRDEHVWFDCRAIAESLKSSTWRFMMRSVPFAQPDTTEASREFADQVAQITAARPDVAALVGRYVDLGRPTVTPLMVDFRAAGLEERRARYLQDRVLDQLRWYQAKSRRAEVMRSRYFWLIAILQIGAVGVAIGPLRPFGVNLMGLIVALAANLTAWTQARRHSELAQAYALAAQELGELRPRVELADSEARLGEAVAAVEAAVSREHTMWMARGSRR